MDQSLIFDAGLIKRYDKAGPRYTSYPTAVQFTEAFGSEAYAAAAVATNKEAKLRPLSLYFHIPFCDTVCFYCGCNKIVTKNRKRTETYLQHLFVEMAQQAALFDRSRMVDQLHWGGGTPTFLSNDQMRALMDETRRHFMLREDDTGEYSIELDPREVRAGTIKLLRDLGFNRISMGVQDFNPAVQKAVNRIQSEKETLAVLEEAKSLNFKSVNLDLIYGLPLQTTKSFSETLDKIIDVNPDRLSIFNYAHLPDLFKTQRQIKAEELPSPAEKLEILQLTIDRLSAAGYLYIGMDHFAKPDDELAVAQREHTLYRNFQGYSTHAECDLIGMGPTAISMVGQTYAQNVREIDSYYERIDQSVLPVFRGIELNDDDLLRCDVITRLICHFHLDISLIEKKYNIKFDDYFAQELTDLQMMVTDGLVEISATVITIPPRGHLLIRNICMVFDCYLRNRKDQSFSKVI
ncbi:MAG: oxygen-independent coproporphyrinogen III oxidase [Gammaproteobacteria bacterium]|nr:oxygen-independent coproporphyrinogen III oxidase [Gammaproteobacteria bacterium]